MYEFGSKQDNFQLGRIKDGFIRAWLTCQVTSISQFSRWRVGFGCPVHADVHSVLIRHFGYLHLWGEELFCVSKVQDRGKHKDSLHFIAIRFFTNHAPSLRDQFLVFKVSEHLGRGLKRGGFGYNQEVLTMFICLQSFSGWDQRLGGLWPELLSWWGPVRITKEERTWLS